MSHAPPTTPVPYPPRGTGKRKGHRKSRLGCLVCKARKVKCQETKPACANCVRAKLQCRYPENGASTLAPVSQSHAMPGLFSLSDMRSFHHFLRGAHSLLPVGVSDNTWVTAVPQLAHEHEFLMHALLAMGGSHLSIVAPVLERELNLENHRLLAMKGLNEMMRKPLKSGPEGDAMIATCFSLVFANFYRGDSIGEYWTLLRGGFLAETLVKNSEFESVMCHKNSLSQTELMRDRLDGLPTVYATHVKDALMSLANLQPFCQQTQETQMLNSLFSTVAALGTPGPTAYFKFVSIYEGLVRMSHDDFSVLVGKNNEIGQVLQGHFVAVECLLTPYLAREFKGSFDFQKRRPIWVCIQNNVRSCSALGQKLLRWPIEFCRQVNSVKSLEERTRFLVDGMPPSLASCAV